VTYTERIMKHLPGYRLPRRRAGILVLWAGLAGLLVGAGAAAAEEPASHVVTVPVAGTVHAAKEDIVFTGQAKIETRLITGSKAPAVAEITVRFAGVTGVGASGTRYQADSPTVLQRRVKASDTIEVNFPYYPEGGDPMAARSAMASFELFANGKTSPTVTISANRPTEGVRQ
jgi:hypothetical protein